MDRHPWVRPLYASAKCTALISSPAIPRKHHTLTGASNLLLKGFQYFGATTREERLSACSGPAGCGGAAVRSRRPAGGCGRAVSGGSHGAAALPAPPGVRRVRRGHLGLHGQQALPVGAAHRGQQHRRALTGPYRSGAAIKSCMHPRDANIVASFTKAKAASWEQAGGQCCFAMQYRGYSLEASNGRVLCYCRCLTTRLTAPVLCSGRRDRSGGQSNRQQRTL